MKILIIRHSQTQANEKGLWEGKGDSKLTDIGIEQSYMLAQMLKDYKIENTFCSPKTRCIQTLEIIKKFNSTMGNISYLNQLVETDFGDWENKNFETISKQYPKQAEEFIKDYKYFTFPNGESFDNFYIRCVNCIDYIISKTDNISLVVTHGGVISCIVSYLKGYGKDMFRDIRINQGYYSLINISQNSIEIELNKDR